MAFDEMVAMIRLAAQEGAGLGIDPARLAVGGDFAGGNLALAAALALRDAGEHVLGFMLLIYGVYSTDTESESWRRFGRGAGFVANQMRWIWDTYLERRSSRATGGRRRISATSPASRRTSDCRHLDPLLDDSHASPRA